MTTTTNATTMNHTTDLEEIREYAQRLLNAEITEELICDNRGNISHPYWRFRYVLCEHSVKESGVLDSVGNPDDYRAAKAIKQEKLDAATTPLQIFRLFSEGWDFWALKYTSYAMNVDDLSEVLRYVWGHSEYAAITNILPAKDALRLLQKCNHHILMSDTEYSAIDGQLFR